MGPHCSLLPFLPCVVHAVRPHSPLLASVRQNVGLLFEEAGGTPRGTQATAWKLRLQSIQISTECLLIFLVNHLMLVYSESSICSETSSIDLADPSERRGLLPSHALNIKGRISKHPKKKKGNEVGAGLTFIRPAAARRSLLTNPSLFPRHLWPIKVCNEGKGLIFTSSNIRLKCNLQDQYDMHLFLIMQDYVAPTRNLSEVHKRIFFT